MTMKKTFLILGLMATNFITANAQLKVTSDGKVKVASDQTSSYSTLLVGNNQFVGSMANIGISGSTTVIGGKSNIGIMGTISINYSAPNVYIGKDINPSVTQGPVVVENGIVGIKLQDGVLIKNDFEVKEGAVFEIKQ